MTRAKEHPAVRRLASTAGVVTAVAGTVLLAVPNRAGPVIGLTIERDARLVGVLDLALAPGLLFGRSQLSWLMARAVSNVLTAAFVLRRATDDPAHRNARLFTGAMVLATAADLRALRATVRSRRAQR
ncbi:hypothetical protein [Mycolicibacterium sp.]